MTAGWIMSRRALIGFLLCCCGATAAADPADEHTLNPAQGPVLQLGDGSWELFRPAACEQDLFDLSYIADGLRSSKPGYVLRFRSSTAVTFDLRFDLVNDRDDFVGPVYDEHIGATTISFAISF